MDHIFVATNQVQQELFALQPEATKKYKELQRLNSFVDLEW
jgi:hypothetical protein